jgi:hypothetical protein
MQTGELYNRVVLRDSKGAAIEKAFLIIDEELWDREMKIATLLLDPGRIKRGLKPNLEMGPALQAGETYTLTVEQGWKNIHGLPTAKQYQKKFICLPADRIVPSIDQAEIVHPYVAESALVLTFNESFDRILLEEAFQITDSRGQPVEGEIKIPDREMSVVFYPRKKWNTEKYTVFINPLLEDLAGNNFTRLFDEDLQKSDQGERQPPAISFIPRLHALAR